MKTWLKRFSIPLLIILAILIVWAVSASLDPEDCSICSHPKAHAPCILNLATGEIGELELYQPYFTMTGEISDTQTGGTFSFIRAAGLTGIKLTDPWYIEISIPTVGEPKNESLFCKKCEKLLKECEQGYILIDLYDVEDPMVYGITSESMYTIRCYSIKVSTEWPEGKVKLIINGELNAP